jgi:signal peptidase I
MAPHELMTAVAPEKGQLTTDPNTGDRSMEPTGPPPTGAEATPAPPPPAAAQHGWLWRVISPLLLAAASVIVLGLLALTVGPKIFPYQALVVRSGSMSPTIPTGSVVFYHQVPASKVKVGQIIVFARPGQAGERVTHRVYKISADTNGRYFETKGDANGAPDDWRIPAVGTGWVAGFHVPVAGYVLADLQSTTARLLLLLIPALGLGLITLTEIWRDRGKGVKT